MMKTMALLCLSGLLTGCAVFDAADFKYLDNENQEMHTVLVTGAEQVVEISLPKSRTVRLPDTLFMKPSGLQLGYVAAFSFPYEQLWGGPLRKNKMLYWFSMGFMSSRDGRIPLKGGPMLSEDVEIRMGAVTKYYEDFDEGVWRDVVLERLVVEKYISPRGYEWVMENAPTTRRHREHFTLPISDERELAIAFWYNEDWAKDHPEWYERRKALSRRILDSVKLSSPN